MWKPGFALPIFVNTGRSYITIGSSGMALIFGAAMYIRMTHKFINNLFIFLPPCCHDPTQSANDHPTYPAPNKRPMSNPDAQRSYRIDFRQFHARFVIPTNAAYLAVVRPTLGSLGKWVDSV